MEPRSIGELWMKRLGFSALHFLTIYSIRDHERRAVLSPSLATIVDLGRRNVRVPSHSSR